MPARSFPVGARSARAAGLGGGADEAQAVMSAAPARTRTNRSIGWLLRRSRAQASCHSTLQVERILAIRSSIFRLYSPVPTSYFAPPVPVMAPTRIVVGNA